MAIHRKSPAAQQVKCTRKFPNNTQMKSQAHTREWKGKVGWEDATAWDMGDDDAGGNERLLRRAVVESGPRTPAATRQTLTLWATCQFQCFTHNGWKSRKHRILMVSDFFFPNFGGVESHIYYLSQCLLKLGHKVVVMTHAYGKRSGVRYVTGGLKVYYVPWRPFLMQNTLPTLFMTFPIIRTILIREKISVVHGHQAFSTTCHEALMHARTMGYKVVFTDHSLYGFADVGSIHMNKVLQFTLADIDQAICVSHTSKENTVLRSGISPEKVFMVPNAVDTAMFTPSSTRLSCDEIIIVVISRLVYRKGADLLVEVIPEVCRLFPKVRFIVGGDRPKRVRLEEMRENSLTEAFCIAILEAASCGLLTVSTRVGGVPEVLPDDMIVLAEPDPEDMVRAVRQAIDILPGIDPQIMHRRMKKLYSWDDVAKRTEIVYDRAMQSSNTNLLDRLPRYLTCGAWAGKLFCLVMIINYLVWCLLEFLQPAEGIEEVPDIGSLHIRLDSADDQCETQGN
ncbi:phosphatidylinositol N-acetylglucosaminyltransferase subunit A-like [Aegilops tauschii subsp. strangulata]|uniref:phosphatidylinositol N-acetylglucosaminyltransferase subunit A-like n=1 Tax=Aegilops tauschii subsp. strangulata TaxID=200361 RepID=UPI003CC88475